jgi:hypothetical protein
MPSDECPKCHLPTLPGAKYCDHCGFALLQASPLTPHAGGENKATNVRCLQCSQANLLTAKFCENCGAKLPEPAGGSPVLQREPYFRLLQSDQCLKFPQGKTSFLIGRQDPDSTSFPEIDLTSLDAQKFGIGRRHARITCHASQVYIEDLNSVNGTFVNRVKIPSEIPTLLKDGDELRLGKLILIFFQS